MQLLGLPRCRRKRVITFSKCRSMAPPLPERTSVQEFRGGLNLIAMASPYLKRRRSYELLEGLRRESGSLIRVYKHRNQALNGCD